jgi:hypothetical protein
MNRIVTLLILCGYCQISFAQPCTILGNQTTYGTSNVWRGYVYDNADLTTYRGYVLEGVAANPNFDQSFGGSNTTYYTNNCWVTTETFSIRYKLTKSFSNGVYEFIVGGDDGYRLSIDGGATWVINQWADQSYQTSSYTVTLNGSYNLVLEYYETSGDNRVSFSVAASCLGSGSTTANGSGNIWRGYVYDGTNFNTYKGRISAGSSGDPSFITDFGGDNTTFATNTCNVQTETFSVRYRLSKNFTAGTYAFVVGADDGYRLSLDGGATWVINQWSDHGYTTTSYNVVLSGTRNLVLEYYENAGGNTISFTLQFQAPLPIHLISFSGKELSRRAELNWDITSDSNPDFFEIEKSNDGTRFNSVGTVATSSGQNNRTAISYRYTDPSLLTGKSFYRLKMTDLSGIVTYSRVVLISGAAVDKNEITIFPTIVSDNTVYLKAGRSMNQALAEVLDISGKKLSTHRLGQVAAGQTVSFQPLTRQLAKGIYIVRITDGNELAGLQKIMVN